MPPTPVPNLRRAEWLDRLVRESQAWLREHWAKLRDRRHWRRRTRVVVKWLVVVALTGLVGGLFREVGGLMAIRLGWTAPPGRSGDRLGAERIQR